MHDPHHGGTFPVGRVVAGLVLLGLIAAASTSQFEGMHAAAPSWSAYMVLGLAGVVVVVVMVFWLSITGLSLMGGRRHTRLVAFATVAALVLAAGAVLLTPAVGHYRSGPGFSCAHAPSYYRIRHLDYEKVCAPSSGGVQRQNGAAGGWGDENAAIVLAAAASLLMLLVVGVALATIIARRARTSVGTSESDVISRALDESLDDLRRERDVKRAIIACYARMEGALARAGMPRHLHETPLEFLGRALALVAPAPGRVLTDLFERAKFSAEPMAEAEKQSAIDALEALRGEVQKAPTSDQSGRSPAAKNTAATAR